MFGVKVNTEASAVEGGATGLLGFLRRKEAGLKV